MRLYIELEEGDRLVREEHGGTFIVCVKGHCFKSLNTKLEDYKPRTKVRADYMGNALLFQTGKDIFETLPWQEYIPKKPSRD